MKKNLFLVCCLLAFASFLANPVRSAETLTLATLDWEPYIGQNMPNQGYVAALVKEAYATAGYEVKYEFMPWARVVALAKEGKTDGYLPEYYAESLKTDFLVSEPFPGGPLGFFKRKADKVTFTNLQDLKDLKIGVVRDYVNTEEFDKAAFLTKEEANDDITNLRKLLGNRLDLAVMDKYVGMYLIQKEMADKAGELEFVSPVLEEKSLYLCISKKTANAEAKIKAFNDGLKAMHDNGKLAALLKSSGF